MKHESILVISSNKEFLKEIRTDLKEDFEVITFSNLYDGLDMLRETNFELLLLDENISSFSTLEAVNKVRGLGKEIFTVVLLSDKNQGILEDVEEDEIYDVIYKPLDKKEISRIIRHAARHMKDLKEKIELEKKLNIKEEADEIIGQSTKIKQLKKDIEKVSENDMPVIILGENGVGKELVAREIYKKGIRRKKPFLSLNCIGLSKGEIETELFGYDKGAFPGANVAKKGMMEEADGGTIFLDEISDLETRLQTKLLKAIEYGEYKRVGSTKLRKSNIRFIVSSSGDLEDEVKKGKFKRDLYNRIITFPIIVPSLRSRKEDVPLLVNYFLHQIVSEVHKDMPVVSGKAMKYLMDYHYPGNIRELKNIVERMVIVSRNRIIEVDDLPLELKMKSETVENRVVSGVGPLKEILEEDIYELDRVEKVVIAMALQKTMWNKQETAKLLGIGRTTLYEKIRKYGLDRRLTSKRKKDE